ncbi:SCP2 sterol-binding domain-containing protein [Actinoplanes siamensis]|uniref:SCP2 domain-containing protein n=1 Tax=Actinoplanes siamensis TaxID=1223317 RepID=A0A919N9R7_9ACTN|nr:SCP2 sterol-binding domain-containing protein [Actinoplanes siamensis]GIF06902.1 hypothetical protein Asi03nite_44400 [Actinoplanes siamensis]
MTDATVTPQMVFDQMPSRFLPEAAGKTRATVQIELSGEQGGVWTVRIAEGRCAVHSGAADKPDVVMSATAEDYVKIRIGRLDPIKAAMPGGALTIKGSYGVAIKFAKMFRRDT